MSNLNLPIKAIFIKIKRLILSLNYGKTLFIRRRSAL